jgi:hypothetical protein
MNDAHDEDDEESGWDKEDGTDRMKRAPIRTGPRLDRDREDGRQEGWRTCKAGRISRNENIAHRVYI